MRLTIKLKLILAFGLLLSLLLGIAGYGIVQVYKMGEGQDGLVTGPVARVESKVASTECRTPTSKPCHLHSVSPCIVQAESKSLNVSETPGELRAQIVNATTFGVTDYVDTSRSF